MNVVWKFPLRWPGSEFEIAMPKGAKVLAVQGQYETPCIWAIVNPKLATETRRFTVVGTGQSFDCPAHLDAVHVGTFQLLGGGFVGHLFELRLTPTTVLLGAHNDGGDNRG